MAPALVESRLVDASGRVRSYRVARRRMVDADRQVLHLALLQDTTAERVARERAERSVRELDDWFDISPVGMVLFDHGGVLVRTNPVFHGLVGEPPLTLQDAAPALRHLLAWDGPAPSPELQPGGRPVERQDWFDRPGAGPQRLRALVRCYQSAAGPRRYMAVVEDRSAEEERDLAQMQIGAMMDTAGVGIATFQESSGWVNKPQPGAGSTAVPSAAADLGASSAALQSISRDIVVPESVPEYETLQSALRHGRRAEVRYAIEHPSLGRRWLFTRVEPATLASGKRTTSVLTLDVTEQHRSQMRSEQLLREMTTILESTTAGIAYLRDQVLVRCNRRFETMLRLEPGAAPGATIEQLFARHLAAGRVVGDGLPAPGEGSVYETEFELAATGSGEDRRWYSLSVRSAAAGADPNESIAVLTDVTRMKNQQIELETLARDRELMFSLSEVGIAFVRDQQIERANQAMAELTGWSVAELSALGLPALFVDADEFQRRWADEERELRLHGRWSGERQLRQRSGRLLWVQVSKRRVDPADPGAGIIASYVDVDARHRAERAVGDAGRPDAIDSRFGARRHRQRRPERHRVG
jgi:PAS domain S-box-containing protein